MKQHKSVKQQLMSKHYVPDSVWDTKDTAINRSIPLQEKFKV